MTHNFSNPQQTIVIGAGLAGACLAVALGNKGFPVTLLDSRASCPPVFKAEKIEPDQAELLAQLGLAGLILPRATPIRDIHSVYNGRIFRVASTEQYGVRYDDMVNFVRANLPPAVSFRLGRVAAIVPGDGRHIVRLEGGEQLTAERIVVACGLNGAPAAQLGLRRICVQKNQSTAIGFMIARVDRKRFAFDAATCFANRVALGVDYLTLFPIGELMRANLFAFPGSDDSWVRRFILQPEKYLQHCFPGLADAIGEYQIVSGIETSLIHLYRTEGVLPHGIALIGDAAQNVCPSTGMGLTKVLTDVHELCGIIERGEPLEVFGAQAAKRAADEKALLDARYRRQARTDRSLRWWLHRMHLHIAMLREKPWGHLRAAEEPIDQVSEQLRTM